jgi:hypothetical protein
MFRPQLCLRLILGTALLVGSAASVLAQSAISGTVVDSSGAVMPGVSVEASSPALIEVTRTVTTDGAGRYTIVDLRPGEYTVSVTAPGFKKFQQEKIDVPAGTIVPVSIVMQLGQTGETVTVQAEAVAVDVESTRHQQVLTRTIQDALPAPRNMQALAALVPGLRLRSGTGANPDVGGSQQVEQTYIVGHGNGAVHTTVLLDGMNINSNYLDGTIQNYVDNAAIQQSTYQTSGIGAEVSAGGTVVNQIPKDGGNQFHGDGFLSYTGNGSFWQANNLNDSLRARGVVTPNSIIHIQDFNGSFGGPIKTNKLWFLTTARYQSTNDTWPGIFNPDGTPTVQDQYIAQAVARLSYQMTSKDKISGTLDKIKKFKGHQLTPLTSVPVEPNAVGRRGGTNYSVAQIKWTRLQSSRLLLEAGVSQDVIYYADVYLRPDLEKKPFTPEWYASATHVNTLTSGITTRTNAGPMQNFFLPARKNFSAAASYVTGTHNLKFGIQDAWGKNDQVSSINADLTENFRQDSAGVLQPVSVTVYNTPLAIRQHVAADLALFVTDTWKYKRLALTGGLRWEYSKSVIDASAVPAGRFIPARSFPQIDCTTIKGLGCWKTFLPRLGAAYDLTGDGKTALRFSFGLYNSPKFTGYLTPFNPMALSTDTRTWADRDLGGQSLPTNGDGIAQDNEIGPSTNVNFGKVPNIPTLDPKFKRDRNMQFSAGFTRQIFGRSTVGMNWYRRTVANLPYLQNRAVDPVTDWIPFQIQNPYEPGTPITAYTMTSAAVQARPAQFYQTNANSSLASNTYTGFEFGSTLRLPHNGFAFIGYTIERQSDQRCDMNIGANNFGIGNAIPGNSITNTSLNDPNSLRFCDQRGLIPFRGDFKLSGAFPVKWGVDYSWSINSSPNADRYTHWDITRTSRYPTDCDTCPNDPAGKTAANPGGKALVIPSNVNLIQTTLRVPLLRPGSKYQDRLNQVDMGLKKNFKIGEKLLLQAQIDVFNVFNASTVLVQGQNLTTLAFPLSLNGPGGQPTQILQARLTRIAFQVHF